MPAVAPHVKAAIDADPNIFGKRVREQFDKLIVGPLSKIAHDTTKFGSFVVIVDALDECDRDEDVELIIQLFLHTTTTLQSLQLRVFATCRPELPIRLGFNAIKGTYQDVILHDIPAHVIEHDIAAYLEKELATIRTKYNASVSADRHLEPGWPGEGHAKDLVKMAVPLFIFAATVCRFLADRRCGNPNKQLKAVLEFRTESQASQLDATYLPILSRLIEGLTTQQKHAVIVRFRDIIGSLVILAIPLSASTLGRIFNRPKDTVDDQLDMLHLVLSIPSSEQSPVRLLHLSFRDFLVDPEKRGENQFWIDEEVAHGHMAMKCLHVLEKHLRTDTCNLVQPGTSRSSINPEVIDAHIPPEVRYACLYWAYHTERGKDTIDDNGPEYHFLLQHVLHWLEALSLIGKVYESLKIIQVLRSSLKLENTGELLGFLEDAVQLIKVNIKTMDDTPLQIYSSALVFAPSNSPVRKALKDQIPNWIALAPKPESNWDRTMVLEGHNCIVTPH
ncbi:hypothetical protein QQX98_005880 [Neonectria punicea]|uniref:Nephrocystin 3-like N-terminal domain-containing protein n=1 Tax=Neonectria punicea TaxID=979145 RepID=A0ABR1H3E2_9HYPO